MSTIREELLGTEVNKKRVMGVIVVALLLVSVFAFSTFFISYIFGTLRLDPNDEKAKAEYEDALLIKPPFPFDDDFFQDFLDDLSQEEFDNLMDILEEMMDGSIDELDLSDFNDALLALLGLGAAEKEVFRVYDYDSFANMTSKLWRYECFDEFTGESWKSNAATNPYNFLTYGEYFSQYSPLDIIQLKMPLSPNLGANSLVIPSFFPVPFIMEDSVYADNLNLGSITLHKTDFNCTILDLDFTSEEEVNMTYDFFGLNLPSKNDINNSAVGAQHTPIFIKNKYLQFPLEIQNYFNTYPNIKTHYDALESIIKDTDNTFVVADKIKNYLLSNFLSPLTGMDIFSYTSPPDGRDVVDYFCEQGEGLWSDFASAFCVFTRAFNVSSRFVDGFNSLDIKQGDDIDEGKKYFAIKYKNLYNWAEIYVPTDISGNGNWVQIDIFEEIPFVPYGGEFNISVSTDEFTYSRPDVANITATLTSENSSIDGRTITFNDYLSGQLIGENITDSNGEASIFININDSQVVGPHIIEAKYGFTTFNYTLFNVLGPIEVNLDSINPTEIDISDAIPDSTDIQGYVYDPINGQRIKNAQVYFTLFQKGTPVIVPNAFNPMARNTSLTGDFDETLYLDPSVSAGFYEIRVDFNGTWWIMTPYFNFPVFLPLINDSSIRLEFNVTEPLPLLFNFFIDGTTSDDNENPIINRNDDLTLTAYLQLGPDPISDGTLVDFYDVTQDIPIGSALTSSGSAQFIYQTDGSTTAGPHLIYAKYGSNFNYSYFILDAPISINLDVWPQNREVSKGATDRTFFIQGYLNDTQNSEPVKYGEISIHLFDGPTEIFNALVLESGSYQLNQYGQIYAVFSVDNSVNIGNYTLEVWCNGTFYHPSPKPYDFYLSYINNFSVAVNADYQLGVYDPDLVIIIFKIEGNYGSLFYNDGNLPETYTRGEDAYFEVWIYQSGNPAPDNSTVRLRDVYTDIILYSYTYNGTEGGYHPFSINTGLPVLHAGLHYIQVEYENNSIVYPYNSTYIIINEIVTVSGISNDYTILRDNDIFTISGTLSESGVFLRGLQVEIILLNSSGSDVSSYLNLFDPKTKFTDDNGYYSFSSAIFQNCPQGEYYILINFTGRIEHSDGILFISLLNPHMVSSNSSQIFIDITAGTYMIGNYETLNYPEGWWYGDTCSVYGYLYWDNGSIIIGMNITITIRDGDGNILATNTAITDGSGYFSINFTVGSWLDDTEVWVYFSPDDLNNFGIPDGLYIEPVQEQLTRIV